MQLTELQKIKEYWNKKYPTIFISLWNTESNQYCGKMVTHNSSMDLKADTIGNLISQGENFLRKVI